MTPEEELRRLKQWLRILGECLTINPFGWHGEIDDITRWGALSALLARAMRNEEPPSDLAAYESIRDWRP